MVNAINTHWVLKMLWKTLKVSAWILFKLAAIAFAILMFLLRVQFVGDDDDSTRDANADDIWDLSQDSYYDSDAPDTES